MDEAIKASAIVEHASPTVTDSYFPSSFAKMTSNCERIKEAQFIRHDDVILWCWRRILRVRWMSRRTNECVVEEIKPEYSLESAVLRSKVQYFGHLMRRHGSPSKSLMLGKLAGKRRRGRQKLRWIDGIMEATSLRLARLQDITEGR
ncbi:hypothetical protein M514_09454 [Trichuris suis]|uniref:Uncharacterized protein n=1 Tax=Trichuris suis TaxID=68888 RepID=A0A085N9X5_9BILA|nr:hypothetical protein M513_09454 [Trichuris suis]KFD66271.1 hypothetical protein M514_09454 [Trichuris suis]